MKEGRVVPEPPDRVSIPTAGLVATAKKKELSL